MLAELKRAISKPSPLEMAAKELVAAEHARLEAQSAAEYAASVVAYNDKRITRLLKYINDSTKEVA